MLSMTSKHAEELSSKLAASTLLDDVDLQKVQNLLRQLPLEENPWHLASYYRSLKGIHEKKEGPQIVLDPSKNEYHDTVRQILDRAI